ncbi:hypothetical protein BGW36DRAFT_453398 [Talaromyces proteolyticus]|uniref:Zn(2)-C6 fungal-type domain-containing protein n=1 Tax=Talaromyces proteolyticus TaxID=1131652 RepID=A0AAD4PYS0_9EURO|nr:uncharacterized protein BGW36DRAFT_453398 [Talaromyces proteolyticus]KAH8695458.1 hypothetical protein BGW36DRAFT_453398 [Talaromyces proteolyticus]
MDGNISLEQPVNARVARRNRTRLACAPCKIRKRKCDGGNPCAACTRYDYQCYYDKPARPRKAVAALLRQHQNRYHQASDQGNQGTSPQELLSRSPRNNGINANNHNEDNNHGNDNPTPSASSERYMEANSGVLFPRTLGLKFNSRNNTQRGECPGWNLGIRHNPRRSEKSINWILAHSAWKELCNVYAKQVHPIYGFLDLQSLYATAQRRWEDPHVTNEYDSVLCGVAALGSLFSPQANWELERHLVECAKEILETSGTIANPSLQDATGWLLRTLYLRCSSSPHAAWMTSCISLHIAEAMGLHQESATGTVSLVYADTATPPSAGLGQKETETKRRIFWIAKLLNTWISFEYGRSRIILQGESSPVPKSDDQEDDYTSSLISLFQISENLDPNKDIPVTILESNLEQLENYDFKIDALTLSQSVLAFTIYRRIQLLGLSVNKTVIERVINLGRRGLEATRRCIDTNRPWWHVNNVPFQFTCILLAIDSPESLVHVRDSITVLKKAAVHFGTLKSRQAFETIDLLVQQSLNRKEQDANVLRRSLLESETFEPEQSQQQIVVQQPGTATDNNNNNGTSNWQNGGNNGFVNLSDLANPVDWEIFVRDLDFSAAFF